MTYMALPLKLLTYNEHGDTSRRACLLNINKQYDDLFDPLSVPFLLNRASCSDLLDLLQNIAKLRNLSKESAIY